MTTRVDIHDGFVRLDAAMTSDMSVVNAARVSFGKSREDEALTEADIGLIKFLMRERHGTPFEHNAFRFHVKCPIFVAREWFRHRIGSFNEFSARYSEMPNEFYVPDAEDIRAQTGKPGAYTFEPLPGDESVAAVDLVQKSYAYAYHNYVSLLELGVAKEQARLVLPVGAYTQFYWTVNARSLMNFLSLRTAETAQKDIRDYANAVYSIAKPTMPVTFAAWEDNFMVAP